MVNIGHLSAVQNPTCRLFRADTRLSKAMPASCNSACRKVSGHRWFMASMGRGYTVIIYLDNTQNTCSSLLGKIWNNMGEMEPDSDSHGENIMINWYTIGFWGYFYYFWTVDWNRKVGKMGQWPHLFLAHSSEGTKTMPCHQVHMILFLFNMNLIDY